MYIYKCDLARRQKRGLWAHDSGIQHISALQRPLMHASPTTDDSQDIQHGTTAQESTVASTLSLEKPPAGLKPWPKNRVDKRRERSDAAFGWRRSEAVISKNTNQKKINNISADFICLHPLLACGLWLCENDRSYQQQSLQAATIRRYYLRRICCKFLIWCD